MLSDKLQGLFSGAKQFFVCNTNRKYDERTATNGFVFEQEMLTRGFACAWERFKFPGHMHQVKPADAIFLFAKGVGIIGVGEAKDKCEKLAPGDSNRIRNDGYEEPEWRVPVNWLKYTDEAGAYEWKNAPNFTFWNVTGSQYDDFREDVKKHFLSDVL